MAATQYFEQVQKIFIAFYQRPADPAGLKYWAQRVDAAGGDFGAVIDAFASSPEAVALYGTIDAATIGTVIDSLYMALFNTTPDATGKAFYTEGFANGTFTAGTIALAVLNGAQNDDLVAVQNKVQVANEFTQQVDGRPLSDAYFGSGTSFNVTYAGDADAQAARDLLKGVTFNAATVLNPSQVTEALQTQIADATDPIIGQTGGKTYTLTTGIDSFTGTAGNDTFNAPVTDGGTPTQTFGGLDSVDGGAGVDTLSIDFGTAVATLPATATIKNIENLTVSTTNTTATTDGVDLDVTGLAGVQSVTVANGGTKASVVKGGETVSVTGGAAATVSGTALKSVTVSKAATATVSNDTAATAGAGTTLTAVTLDNLTGATSTLTGAGIVEVSVKNQKVAHAATVVNAVSTALTVNVDGAGYDAAGAEVATTGSADVEVVAGSKAATITVNATGSKSSIEIRETTAGAAKTLNLTGSAALKITDVATSLSGLTTIAGAAATGNLDLGTLGASAATVTTGSGNDKFQLAASKVTVDAGAGNDTVTLGSTLALGSTVKLGAGNDTLLAAGGVVTGKDATGTVVIDAGEGTDSVAASLVNAANATQFLNFEQIDLSAQGTTATNLDIALMTGSTITGLTLNGDAAATTNPGNTVQNLAAGAGLTVAGVNSSATTIGVKDAATGTADAFTVTFAGADVAGATATAPNVTAGTIAVAGIEALTIASNGGSNTWNSIDLGLNKALKTIAITGDKNLDLTFGAQNGADAPSATAGVSSIDGSAATGKLNITIDADVKAVTGGLVVKGGSAADTIITGAASTTLTGNAGIDAFDVTAAKAGAGAATVAILEAAAVKTTITDFVKGETIQFAATTPAVATAAVTKITLDATVQNLDDALNKVVATAGTYWFNYGADTYVVVNNAADAGLDQGDVLVKLTGTLDLSNSTTTNNVLTFA